MIRLFLFTLLILSTWVHAGINTIATVKYYSSASEQKELQFFVKSFILPDKDLIMVYREHIRRYNAITSKTIWEVDVKKNIIINDDVTPSPIKDIQFSPDNKILAIRLDSYLRLYAVEDGRLINETRVADFIPPPKDINNTPHLQITKKWLTLWNDNNIVVYTMPTPPKSDLVTRFLSFLHTPAPEPLVLVYRWKAIQHEGEGYYVSIDKFHDVHISQDQTQVIARNSIGLQKWSLATGKLFYDSFKMYPIFLARGYKVSGSGEYLWNCRVESVEIAGAYISAKTQLRSIELTPVIPVHIANMYDDFNSSPCKNSPDKSLLAVWQPNVLRGLGFELHVYNMKGGQYLNIIEPNTKPVKDVMFSGDSQRLVSRDDLGRLRVYDINMRKLLTQTLEASTDKLMAIDTTGHYLLLSDTVRSQLVIKEIK